MLDDVSGVTKADRTADILSVVLRERLKRAAKLQLWSFISIGRAAVDGHNGSDELLPNESEVVVIGPES